MSLNEPAESSVSIDVDRVEIVIDEDYPDRVEIYMLDEEGQRIEGGTFKKSLFMDAVLEFYNRHF